VTVRGRFDEMPSDEVYAGVKRRSFSSEQATVTSYRFAPGAAFPRHRHPQEQITLIEDGEVELSVGDRVESLAAGDWSVIEPDVEHGITAGSSGATVVAIVVPRRESIDAYTVIS
jgi:quercetin dioxygenase-like cupin family protein